jgi:hypothetical protein
MAKTEPYVWKVFLKDITGGNDFDRTVAIEEHLTRIEAEGHAIRNLKVFWDSSGNPRKLLITTHRAAPKPAKKKSKRR